MWFIGSLRPVGSTPCLLSTPPRGDAVGTVFGAEPSNCTVGTFTRVDARFTGALRIDKAFFSISTLSPHARQRSDGCAFRTRNAPVGNLDMPALVGIETCHSQAQTVRIALL
jgi:hypothetical protein